MNSSSAARAAPSLAGFAALAAPPLAAGALLVLVAAFQADRAGAAETAYLALWIAAVLLPTAALAPAPAWESMLGAPLAVLAVWSLPAGPARSAVVGALLVSAFAVAAARRIGRTASAGELAAEGIGAAPRRGAGDRAVGLPHDLALTLPLALGAQALLRGELLLAPGASEIAALVGLPAAGALALAVLAARCGLPAALLAGAAVVTLGPGWTAVTALALAGAALGAEVQARVADAGDAASPLALTALGLLLGGGLLTETRASIAALAAAVAIACSRGRRHGTVAAFAAVAALAAAALAPLRSWQEALAVLAWVPILLPALVWAPALPRARWTPLLAAVGLAAACAAAVPGPAATTAALAALAVLLTAPGRGRAGDGWNACAANRAATSRGEPAPKAATDVAGRLLAAGGFPAAKTAQGIWSAALLGGTALLASYPWLRPAPAADALTLVGLAPGWAAAAMVVAAALAIGLGVPAAVRGPGRRRVAVSAAAIAIAVAVFAALPRPGRPAFSGAAALMPQRPRLAVELDGSPAGTVAVVSNLSGAAELAAGTEVASVRLLDTSGRRLARWVLRAGEDTGEWAARRPDVAASPALVAPPAWTAWVAGSSGDGAAGAPFFGQLYRTRRTVPDPAPAARLVIERNPALPPGVGISLQRVEVGP